MQVPPLARASISRISALAAMTPACAKRYVYGILSYSGCCETDGARRLGRGPGPGAKDRESASGQPGRQIRLQLDQILLARVHHVAGVVVAVLHARQNIRRCVQLSQ